MEWELVYYRSAAYEDVDDPYDQHNDRNDRCDPSYLKLSYFIGTNKSYNDKNNYEQAYGNRRYMSRTVKIVSYIRG